MGRSLRNGLLGCLALLLAAPAFSGPMGFKDSWMAMGDVSPNWQKVFANSPVAPGIKASVNGMVCAFCDQGYICGSEKEDRRH